MVVISRTSAGPWLLVAALLQTGCHGNFPPTEGQRDEVRSGRSGTARRLDSPRFTGLVELVRERIPAVVSIRLIRPTSTAGQFEIQHGTGALIHPSGVILTNHHVLLGSGQAEVRLWDGRTLPLEIVARSAQDDLALIRVADPEPLPALPLGRSDDLMLGEPVVVIGNPGGLENSVSEGIISGLNRSTATQAGFMPQVIQTTAAINGGNSGGPLLNALGQQIGVICSKQDDAQNIGFAISIDHVRQVVPEVLAVEARRGFVLGIETDPLADEARVEAVATGSPAELAGVIVGDVVRRVGNWEVADGVGLSLGLLDRAAGEDLPLVFERDGRTHRVTVTLAAYPCPAPIDLDEPVPGLRLDVYEGRHDHLPDLDGLEVAERATTGLLQVPENRRGTDEFVLCFHGFLKAPVEGLYSFHAGSDDGSRVVIAGQSVVENDGLHSHQVRSGSIRLSAGLHPVEVWMFEAGGDESLRVDWEGPGFDRQELPTEALFCAPLEGD